VWLLPLVSTDRLGVVLSSSEKVYAGAAVATHMSQDRDNHGAGAIEDDPLFSLPTAASGRSDISEHVDEHVADALASGE
jgi:hypothetical protein